MKKIISLILALIFIFTYPTFSLAEDIVSSDVSFSSDYGLLSTLGILTVDENNYNVAITRQEFAKIIFKLITNSDLYTEDYTYSSYSDVTDSEYIGYVNEMVRLKVINGYSDGTFRPYNEITLTEAVTFIIRAIGYDIKAEASGGYPTGYLQEAQRAGLLKGVSVKSDETITFLDCGRLIKNTLLAKLQQKSGFSSDGSVSYTEQEYTILNSVYRVGIITDVVNGIDMTKLSGESTVAPWHILIGQKELDIGKLEPREYLGYEVEAYYTIDDDILIHIEKTGRNNIAVIDVKDIKSIDNSSNIITEEGYYKNTEYKCGILTNYIYNNGISKNPFTLDMFSGKNGALTLIDNNGDKIYDVIKADVYYDIVCDYVDTSSDLVYDLITGKPISVDMTDENPYIDVFDLAGNITDVKNIKPYDILSVFETLPEHEQKYIKIIVSNNSVTGNVGEISYDDYGRIVTAIAGNTYTFTKEAMNYFGTSYDAGKKYVFTLNFDGYIAGVKDNATDLMSFGVILNYYVEETPVERTIRIIYMSQDGKKQETGLRKWVTIDNIKYKNDDLNLLKHLDRASDLDFGERARCNGTQVIKYQLDANRNLSFIDTVAYTYDVLADTAIPTDEDSEFDTYNALRRGASSADATGEPTFYWNAQCYDWEVYIGSRTKAFSGPYRNLSDSSVYKETDNYRVSAFNGYNDYYTSYYDDPDSYLASLVFFHRVSSNSDGASGYDVTFSVFDKYTYAVNNEGVTGYNIYYWEGRSYKSAFAAINVGWTDSSNKLGEGKIKITPDKLKQGDVLRFSRMSDDSIANYRVCYRADGDIFISEYDTGSVNGELLYSGYLYRKYSDGASYARETAISSVTDDSKILYFNTEVPVIVYNPEKKAGHRLSTDNHQSGDYYTTSGDGASRIMINVTNGKPLAVYIIKR
ncbi:MAG: S-layer homology domain-containing protein [Ruminococcaceae bacterium]|nr:S-layer homology domain-containing protein [Oscillospiraceae bacterium]